MKYFITIFILLIGLFVFGTILKTEYSFVFEIIFIVLTIIIAFFWEYSLLNKTFDSDFKIRSQKKNINIFDIGMAIFWTLFAVFLNDNSKMFNYLIIVFWTIPFIELIMWFIYKSKKPYTIFIKDNELILNRRWILKRNLSELIQIQYDRFNKNFKLDFKSKSEISIKTTEYNPEDIKSLLQILIKKSDHDVFIPPNFKLNKKATTNFTEIP